MTVLKCEIVAQRPFNSSLQAPSGGRLLSNLLCVEKSGLQNAYSPESEYSFLKRGILLFVLHRSTSDY